MKQFFSVLRFELSGYFKNKVFMGMTIALVLIVACVLTLPRVLNLFQSDSAAPGTTVSEPGLPGAEPGAITPFPDAPAVALRDDGGLGAEGIALLQNALLHLRLVPVADGDDALRTAVTDGTYKGAIVLHSALSATYIVPSVGMYDSPGYDISQALQSVHQLRALQALGAQPEQIGDILAPQVNLSVENLGISQMDNFFYTYILIFALYMAILIYGQLVATAVATEKSSRTMELLITSARPNALLFGKIIAAGTAGLMQMAAIFGSAVVFYAINASAWAGNPIIASIFSMPVGIVAYALLFFLLGFFLYAFCFGAMGSLASRTEDTNTLILPPMLLFVFAFMIVMMSLASGTLDSPLMVFASYLPVTSPMAMFARIAMSSPAWYEILISVALLLAATAGVGLLAARVYRIGVLMYGKPPKIGELARMLRAERGA